MIFSCTTDKYDALYERWLAAPGRLLDLAGYKPSMRLLDLCGGTGAVSKEALKRGSRPEDICLFDLNPRYHEVPVVQGDVNDLRWGHGLSPERFDSGFDLIVCRQAISYFDLWAIGPVISLPGSIEYLLAPGGKFVFNVFVKPKWSLKTYKLNGRRFFEASWFCGRQVYHVQASPGLGFDISRFFWYKEEELRRAFWIYFDIEVHSEGASQRWVCTRRDR